MADTTFETWAGWVVAQLRAENGKLFQAAIDATKEEADEDPPTEASELLAWMRGDEPEEAWDADDSAADYARFLLTEWDLYGPQGE